MKEAKYSLNDVIIFVHGQRAVKGIIDEIILHYTQENVIVKYIIRPYGLGDYVTIDENKICENMEIAKKTIIENLKRTYTKGNLIKNYEQAKEDLQKKYKDQIDSFDERFTQLIDSISEISEEYYDNLEKVYQKQKEKTNAKEEK